MKYFFIGCFIGLMIVLLYGVYAGIIPETITIGKK